MSKWYESEDANKSPIISSRIRLARNLSAYPFSAKITDAKAHEMISEVRRAAPGFDFCDPAKEDRATRLSMVEKHDISPEIFSLGAERPIALLRDETAGSGIMLGEEDHIRIQVITAGDDLESAYTKAAQIDDLLEESLTYAYHKDFGYLTSCPTNTGTGLRASYMVHIPMLESSGNLPKIVSGLAKLGMTVRGIYGEHSKPFGSIYQVSNQVTLGKSENEIISALKNTCVQLVENELSLLKRAFTNNPDHMEDKIFRALGALTHARIHSLGEAMENLSAIRVGIISGVLRGDNFKVPVYSIMMNIEPGNMQSRAGGHLSENEMLIARAKYLREIFSF